MTRKVTIDFVTLDATKTEYALYLVENGPWEEDELEARLRSLQDRIYNAVDAAIEGGIAEKYPETRGLRARIQVDCYDDPPPIVEELVSGLHEFVQQHPDYQQAIQTNGYVTEVRIVTGRQMGRDQSEVG